MCEFIGKSNERILCKLSKSEILRFYSIVHVAKETTKTSNFTCQSKSFIIIFFTCQVSACELQPFSCHNLANDLYSETAKTVFSHLNSWYSKISGYFLRQYRSGTQAFSPLAPLVAHDIICILQSLRGCPYLYLSENPFNQRINGSCCITSMQSV